MIHEAKNKHGGLIVVAIGCEMNNNKNVRSTICLKCGKLIKQKTSVSYTHLTLPTKA